VAAGSEDHGAPRSVVAGQALWVLSLTFISLPVPVASVDFVSDRFDASWLIGMSWRSAITCNGDSDHLTYGPLGYIDHPSMCSFGSG